MERATSPASQIPCRLRISSASRNECPRRSPEFICFSSHSKSRSPGELPRPLICSSRRTADITAGAAAPGSVPADLVTYSVSSTTDLPLYEPPGVSFDDYLCDTGRVFRAFFPDDKRSQRLNNEEWKVEMLPITYLLFAAHPVVVLRLRHLSNGVNYPPSVPEHATAVLDFTSVSCELRGLTGAQIPPDFHLQTCGALYACRRRAGGARLRGWLEISIGFIPPPMIAMIPSDIRRSIADAVLTNIADRMKSRVNEGLLTDFRKFQREKKAKRETAGNLPTIM